MDQVMLESADWNSGVVPVARTFRERWRGLKRPGVESLLLETRSVHGFGMRKSFQAIGLTESLRVSDARIVRPSSVAFFAGCRYVLEIPATSTPPSIGTTLEMRHV